MIRLLADENVPLASICRLREAGLEVIAVCEELAGSPDDEILERAVAEEAVIVTFDLDFGALVFQLGLPSPKGIILLRIIPKTPDEPAEILLSILQGVEIEVMGHLTVVESDRLRQRLLPSG